MYPLVCHKAHFVPEMLTTLLALMWPLSRMKQRVVFQMNTGFERFITLITTKFSDILVEGIYVSL